MTTPGIERIPRPLAAAPGAGRRNRGHREAVPRAVSNARLGTALFVAAETMVFAGLVSSFLILRANASDWPPAGQPRLPVGVTGVNTLVLLASAFTMVRAARAAKEPGHAAGRYLRLTGLLGSVFLLVQGIEWARLMGFGLTAASSNFGAAFYTLIGCHGVHVAGAVLALEVLRRRHARGEAVALDALQLYWLFVVAVWPILYVLVYLG